LSRSGAAPSCDQTDCCDNAQSNRLKKRTKQYFEVEWRVVPVMCFMVLSPESSMVVKSRLEISVESGAHRKHCAACASFARSEKFGIGSEKFGKDYGDRSKATGASSDEVRE